MNCRSGWGAIAAAGVLAGHPAAAQVGSGPSFDCSGVADGSIEATICADPDLAALDRTMADVFAAAVAKATDTLDLLRAEQRGWIAGRDECWKSDDRTACVRGEYVRRIAELQATYRLVPFVGPVFYACDGNPANEVVAIFFETEPPTLIAERGDSVSVMYLERSASGSRYVGRNESLWSKGRDATVVWGHEAQPMQCTQRE